MCVISWRNPDAVVVHIGCGLDTRFERVDNGAVEWFDLDLPDVIALRKNLIGGEKERYHILSGSIFENVWIDALSDCHLRPFLFIAEGVLPYFEMEQVKSLVLTIRDHFPGAELVCDAHTPFAIRVDNLQLAFARVNARLRWGLKRGKDVENWGAGITILEDGFNLSTMNRACAPIAGCVCSLSLRSLLEFFITNSEQGMGDQILGLRNLLVSLGFEERIQRLRFAMR